MFENVTLYHRNGDNFVIYPLIVSIRDSNNFTRTQTNQEMTNSILIRIFDKDNPNYEISKNDIIVKKSVNTEIKGSTNPITDLRKIHGKENVFSINFIKYNRFDTELDHIRVELI